MKELHRSPEANRLSQVEAAAGIGITKTVLSKWKVEGVLLPLRLGPDPSIEGYRGTMDAYTLRDVAVGIFANVAIHDLAFKGEGLRLMVQKMQHGTDEDLKRAVLLTVKTKHKMMRHIYVEDVTMNCDAHARLLHVKGKSPDGMELLRRLQYERRLVSKATFYELLKSILAGVKEGYLERQMGKTKSEAT